MPMSTQTIANASPWARIIPQCPETFQKAGIVLEFFWRRWNFFFAGWFSSPCKHRTRFVILTMCPSLSYIYSPSDADSWGAGGRGLFGGSRHPSQVPKLLLNWENACSVDPCIYMHGPKLKQSEQTDREASKQASKRISNDTHNDNNNGKYGWG